jgi:hypothetical protein
MKSKAIDIQAKQTVIEVWFEAKKEAHLNFFFPLIPSFLYLKLLLVTCFIPCNLHSAKADAECRQKRCRKNIQPVSSKSQTTRQVDPFNHKLQSTVSQKVELLLVNGAAGAASIDSTHAFSRVSRSLPTLGAAATLA